MSTTPPVVARGSRRQSVAARVEGRAARIKQRSARGVSLTAIERKALLELISAIVALLGEEC